MYYYGVCVLVSVLIANHHATLTHTTRNEDTIMTDHIIIIKIINNVNVDNAILNDEPALESSEHRNSRRTHRGSLPR